MLRHCFLISAFIAYSVAGSVCMMMPAAAAASTLNTESSHAQQASSPDVMSHAGCDDCVHVVEDDHPAPSGCAGGDCLASTGDDVANVLGSVQETFAPVIVHGWSLNDPQIMAAHSQTFSGYSNASTGIRTVVLRE